MKQIVILLLILSMAFWSQPPAVSAVQRPSMSEYEFREMVDAVRGTVLSRESAGNLWRIYQQLVEDSGMRFTVLLGQTYNWGQSHAGGVIIFDRSIAVKSADVVAFVMAHEWGHEALGHQPNFYHPYGEPWRYRPLPTSDEDAADRYAGEFLGRHDYDIKAIARFLAQTPKVAHGDAHSDGPARARNIADAAGVDLKDGEGRQDRESITFTVEIEAIRIGALGAEVSIYIDDKYIGKVSNMGQTSITVKQLTAGRHRWRLRAQTYVFDAYGRRLPADVLAGSGSITIDDDDSLLIKGTRTYVDLVKE